MNEEALRNCIKEACGRLYNSQKDLITAQAHERTIGAYMAEYLRPLFEGWQVDSEYNREGIEGRRKRDERGGMVPDIIIHKRGQRLGANLAAIEIKGHWNREERAVDEEKLRRIRAEYGYQFVYRLELGPEAANLIRVD